MRRTEESSSLGIDDPELRNLYDQAREERKRLLQDSGDIDTMSGMRAV